MALTRLARELTHTPDSAQRDRLINRIDRPINKTNRAINKTDRIPGEPGECHYAYGRLRQRPYGISRYRDFDRGFGLSDRPPDRWFVRPKAAL